MGPVVDVQFPPGALPEVFTSLKVSNASIDEREHNLVLEVAQHLGETVARDRAAVFDANDIGLPIGLDVIGNRRRDQSGSPGEGLVVAGGPLSARSGSARSGRRNTPTAIPGNAAATSSVVSTCQVSELICSETINGVITAVVVPIHAITIHGPSRPNNRSSRCRNTNPTGMTSSVNNVEVMSPPITVVANGRHRVSAADPMSTGSTIPDASRTSTPAMAAEAGPTCQRTPRRGRATARLTVTANVE